MGATPDYVRLAAEVLAIRNAPPDLARRLVTQALVLEDRRESWIRLGERITSVAPQTAGVYVLRDAAQRALYVGKAINLRRRLRTHFSPRRWKAMRAELSRVEDVTWREVGSELEALLLEAHWIRDLQPIANVQRGDPSAERPASLVARDVVVILPSIEPESVELVAARASGATEIQRTGRSGASLAEVAESLWSFVGESVDTASAGGPRALAPIVFSWLAARGRAATRLEVRELTSADDLRYRLSVALASPQLFNERIVLRNSHNLT